MWNRFGIGARALRDQTLRRKALSSGQLAVWRQTESEQSPAARGRDADGPLVSGNIHETEFVRGTDPVAARRAALKLLQFRGALGRHRGRYYDHYTTPHRGVRLAVAHSDAMPIADVAAMPQLATRKWRWTIGTGA